MWSMYICVLYNSSALAVRNHVACSLYTSTMCFIEPIKLVSLNSHRYDKQQTREVVRIETSFRSCSLQQVLNKFQWKYLSYSTQYGIPFLFQWPSLILFIIWENARMRRTLGVSIPLAATTSLVVRRFKVKPIRVFSQVIVTYTSFDSHLVSVLTMRANKQFESLVELASPNYDYHKFVTSHYKQSQRFFLSYVL